MKSLQRAGCRLGRLLRPGVIYTIGPGIAGARAAPEDAGTADDAYLPACRGFTEVLLARLQACELDVLVLRYRSRNRASSPNRCNDEAFCTWSPHQPIRKLKTLRRGSSLDEPLLMLGAGNCFPRPGARPCAWAGAGESPARCWKACPFETIRHMVARASASPDAGQQRRRHCADDLLRDKAFHKPADAERLVWRSSSCAIQGHRFMRRALLDCVSCRAPSRLVGR